MTRVKYRESLASKQHNSWHDVIKSQRDPFLGSPHGRVQHCALSFGEDRCTRRRLEERIALVERGGQTRQVERLPTASPRVLLPSDNSYTVEGGKPGLDGVAGMRKDGGENGWNDRWAGTPGSELGAGRVPAEAARWPVETWRKAGTWPCQGPGPAKGTQS